MSVLQKLTKKPPRPPPVENPARSVVASGVCGRVSCADSCCVQAAWRCCSLEGTCRPSVCSRWSVLAASSIAAGLGKRATANRSECDAWPNKVSRPDAPWYNHSATSTNGSKPRRGFDLSCTSLWHARVSRSVLRVRPRSLRRRRFQSYSPSCTLARTRPAR